MRGMIKWRPFNSLMTNKEIYLLSLARNKISRPILSVDKIREINDILIYSIYYDKVICVKYYDKYDFKEKCGLITDVDKIKKYILVDNFRIYFRDIVNVYVL